jgi:hypothetical protein
MKKLSLFFVAALLAPAMASAQDAASGASYPRCSATVTDQCTEGGGMGMMMHHKMKHGHHKHHAKAKAKK